MNLNPEQFAQNKFEYSRFLRPNEIDMVNRKVGKVGEQSTNLFGKEEDTIEDLKKFFIKPSEQMKESHLNYFLIKKWKVSEYNKKAKDDQKVLIYLSVDFFYSIYIEREDKAGKLKRTFKASFHAETSELVVKEIEKVIEISYISKGFLWDSSKKIKLRFPGDSMDEFILHHQRAKTIFNDPTSKKARIEQDYGKKYMSSINLTGKYTENTQKEETISGVKERPLSNLQMPRSLAEVDEDIDLRKFRTVESLDFHDWAQQGGGGEHYASERGVEHRISKEHLPQDVRQEIENSFAKEISGNNSTKKKD